MFLEQMANKINRRVLPYHVTSTSGLDFEATFDVCSHSVNVSVEDTTNFHRLDILIDGLDWETSLLNLSPQDIMSMLTTVADIVAGWKRVVKKHQTDLRFTVDRIDDLMGNTLIGHTLANEIVRKSTNCTKLRLATPSDNVFKLRWVE